MPHKNFLIIAHRGESFNAPENTYASINLAWERNDDAVEIDVRLTKDKKVVVIHDKTTLRTGGRFKKISTSDYSELVKVNVGKYKGKRWENEKIPLLDKVLESMPKHKHLFVEIKSSAKIIKPLEKLIDQKKIRSNQIKFIGFDIDLMKSLKQILPEFESYWIIKGKDYKKRTDFEEMIRKCKSAGLNGLDVEEKKYLSKEVIQTVKDFGLRIYTWTVDDQVRAKQLFNDGIDGITTNKAYWIKNKFKEAKIL
ncbi:MAG: glycerophosphodiester phosphodiesterase family protein [Ignavibacteriaceae bacterium]|jgi:glycerophosphoryl diester phosphodiesterase|nr:glycerophosphodiester phosphodiesterase family protein [Ignavibacteriaceae bacterium]MCW8812119.1 glycerophosphodiester phosphodiesterase family protein [Chlorobium sp.]MCW8816688.1 glycerophosphodiester phosphodiesterase family protein [Ignavibacteriaceae bacterium]MCW9095662.1 glycerophosphodiester phosphodiesterase family protein [Ignavibacteriaceae bacterium]MCW9097707.1 glycerophosphodiester phosphodiesterase family protein [Ignavibacteriaceae bacterium]